MKKIAILFFLLALLVFAGFFGSRFLTKPIPKTSTTSNEERLKIYTNTTYKYSFEYPETWYIKDLTKTVNASNILDSQYLNTNDQIDLQNYKVSASVQNIDLERTKHFLNYGDAGMKNEAKTETKMIGGKEVVLATVTFSQLDRNTNTYVEEGKSYQALIPLGSNTLIIAAKYDQKEVVDKILTTLKFTDTPNPEGKFCGGIANIQCPTGFKCVITETYPDAGGTCVKKMILLQ